MHWELKGTFAIKMDCDFGKSGTEGDKHPHDFQSKDLWASGF